MNGGKWILAFVVRVLGILPLISVPVIGLASGLHTQDMARNCVAVTNHADAGGIYCYGVLIGMVHGKWAKCGLIPGIDLNGFVREMTAFNRTMLAGDPRWETNGDTALISRLLDTVKMDERGCPLEFELFSPAS